MIIMADISARIELAEILEREDHDVTSVEDPQIAERLIVSGGFELFVVEANQLDPRSRRSGAASCAAPTPGSC
jgi:hypothetical protein